MSSYISITQSNKSGFVSVPGDPLAAISEDGEDAELFSNYLDTVFDGATWSVDVEFVNNLPDEAVGEEVTYTPEECVDVRVGFDWSEFSLNFTKLNNTKFRLAGPSANVFPNEFYKFKMADYTEQVLPPSVEEPFFSLIQYQMPQPVSTLKDYDFTVLYVDHVTIAPTANWRIWSTNSSTYSMRYTNSSDNIVVESFSTLTALQTRYNQLNLSFENWDSANKAQYDINQWFFWRFQTAVSNIAALVARGLK